MGANEKNASIQELAEFLRDIAYSEKLFRCTDKSLFAIAPKDENGDIVYEGGLYTHDRVVQQIHHYSLRFSYTVIRGIFDITAKKDGSAVPVNGTMNFEQFVFFTKDLFEVEDLYKSPKHTQRCNTRPSKNVPSLQGVLEFMVHASKPENTVAQPVDWTVYVVHPSDNDGYVSYSGGLWTHHDLNEPYPEPYNSLHFSYSEKRGIYGFKAWKDKGNISHHEKMTFEDFKAFAVKLFSITNLQSSTEQNDRLIST